MTACVAGTAERPQRNAAWRSAAALLAFVLLAGSLGCGGPARRAISGTVTLDGRPLDEAVIMFIPLDATGRKTGSQIKAGQYEVADDVGLIPGQYRVEIGDDPPVDASHQPRPPSPPSGPRRRLPSVYTTVASPLSLEVTANGETVFDFALLSKPTSTP